MRSTLLISCIILTCAMAAVGEESSSAKERASYIRSHYAKFEYKIPMRDGTKLFTAVYVPNAIHRGKKFPILMSRTPYSVGPYGESSYPEVLGLSKAVEEDGYIFVYQDVRGRWMSEGQFVNMRPVGQGGFDESTDAYDTIDWLVKHVPGNNGAVGIRGVSYPGYYSACAAINNHPALKASSPQAPIADWWMGDDMHRNGALNLQLAFTFFGHFGRPRPEPTTDYLKPMDYGTTDAYQYFMDIGPLKKAASRYGFDNSHWRELEEHPNYDEFWRSRNLLPHLKNVQCSTMVVGGWYDTEDLYGPLHIYQELKRNASKKPLLVMGPWEHGGWTREGRSLGDVDFGYATANEYQEAELAYFRQTLKGGQECGLPGAWVFETGVNRWRSFPSWPPSTERRKIYLSPKQQLTWTAGPADSHQEFISDPNKPVPYTIDNDQMKNSKNYMAQDQRYAARRPDVLVFQTEPLKEPLTLAGSLPVELFVSTDQTDCDWVVKVIDVSPGKVSGKGSMQQTLVRGEPFRGRFREGGDRPKPFTPNQVTPIRYVLNDVFHTFAAGHRLMVQVHSTWFPFIDRNPQKFVPNIFDANESDFVTAHHRVFLGGQHSSNLELPVLKGPAAQ